MPGNGKAALCFRIGYLQRGDNQPGTHMGWGGWGQAMWLSNRDLCQAMERSVMAEGIGFAVLNLMSDNPGMRWDIATTKRTIGYAPQDGAAPVLTETIEQDERSAHDMRRMAERLDAVSLMRRW
jgi:NAD+ dependent glucose-6-phosphate dehydrogenase